MSCRRWACPRASRAAVFGSASAGPTVRAISIYSLRLCASCSSAAQHWRLRRIPVSEVYETSQRVADLSGDKYKYGFVTDIEMERAEKGLNEDVVRFISAKKCEPEWMLQWRLAAFQRWRQMQEPKWAR